MWNISPAKLIAELVNQRNSVQKHQDKISQDDDTQMRPIGLQFTATQGTTTHYTWKFPETLCLQGGKLHMSNVVFGDKLDLKVTDEDNVLGYGAGFVLNDYVKDWNVPTPDSNGYASDEIKDKSISDPITNLFYLKVSVTAEAGTDRKVGLNLWAYKSLS